MSWKVDKLRASNFMSFEQVSLTLASTCYVLRGENKQNEGQNSNGSGKTSLVDLFAVALLGYSLTGRNVKDCISWHTEDTFFTVTLDLVNPKLNRTCTIHRKIYSNTRSQELSLLVDGQVPPLPSKKGVENGVDLKAGNQYILQEILDLTEDDLLTHYLISAAHYRPFLHLNTQDKLAVIARFAKTQPVDRVLTGLDTSLRGVTNNLLEDQTKLNEGDGYLKALEEQLSQEAEDAFNQVKQVEVDRFTVELANSVQVMVDKQAELQQVNDKLVGLNGELAELTQDTAIDALKTQVEEVKKVQGEISQTIQDLQVKINAANVYTMGLITCPACAHQFNPEVTAPTEDLVDLRATELIFTSQDTEVSLLLKDVEGNLRTAENTISSLHHEIKLATRSQTELTKSAQDLIASHDRVQRYLEEAQLQSFAQAKGDVLGKIQQKQDELADVRSQLLKDQAALDHVKQWQERFLDFKFYVGNQPLERVCGLVNQYLQLADSDLTLQIEGTKRLRSGELRQSLEPTVYRNWTNPQPLHQLSTGEQARLHLAVDLPFQDLLNQASKTGGLDLLVNDELMNSLDSDGVASIAKAFSNLDRTILLVTHSGADLVYDHTILIKKENNVSSIV